MNSTINSGSNHLMKSLKIDSSTRGDKIFTESIVW